MIRGVIFDIGGVLAYDVWEHLLCDPPGTPLSISARYSIPIADMKKVGKELWSEFDCRSGDPDALEREYLDKLKSRFPQLSALQDTDWYTWTEEFIRPINKQGMTDLLQWLMEKGILLGICSNNNEFWFLRQKGKLELSRFFSTNKITLSCWSGINKSDSQIYERAAEVLGIQPVECVFVDDRIENVERAIKCGMMGVLFPSGVESGAEYLRSVLDRVI